MSRNSQFDFYDSLRHPDKLDPEILPDGRVVFTSPGVEVIEDNSEIAWRQWDRATNPKAEK